MSSTQKIRVSDFVAQSLAAHGIRHVFLVTGGGAMHLNDAFGRCKELSAVCCHHEQACAMAAEAYARMSGRLAAVNVTTGPGGTNAITGVSGAWLDSIGMVVISGQVKWETLVRSTHLPLRQLGDQENDIVAIVKSITKYAELVTDPQSIRYHVEKALYLASHGRPGPVWLDIPSNVQGALIDPSQLKGFDPSEAAIQERWDQPKISEADLAMPTAAILEKIKQAKRPVILAGGGIRIAGAYQEFLALAEELKIPVATAWNAHDLLWDEHPLYVGRPGTVGDRPGNFAVQNSDLLLVLGSRLNIRQISYAWDAFARHAFKIVVDADRAELQKPTVKVDLPVHADLGDFLRAALKTARDKRYTPSNDHAGWLEWCKARVAKYPVTLPEYWNVPKGEEAVNPYCFVDSLFKELDENELVVTGDGTACVVTFQAARIKKGQRLFTNSGCASMGYDLPAAVGAWFSTLPEKRAKRIICLAGDGSIQMNLQELQTLVTHKIPAKIFVLNNQGYHSIRQTQRNYFPDNIVGCGTESGLGFPSFEKLAFAYGIPYRKIGSHDALKAAIRETLDQDGPQLCEVFLDLNQQFAPKLASRKLPDGRMVSSPLEDLAPFLPREELKGNMLVPMLET